MSILTRVRTPSGPSPPKSKTKAKAPALATSDSVSSNNSSARLTVGGIANIFIKLRHLESRSKKSCTITCTSGSQPLTHPRAQAILQREGSAQGSLGRKDTYFCAGNGGVNVVPLLRATRRALVEQAEMGGANVLVNERWSYVINEPKHRTKGQFKISVQYSASAVRAHYCDTLQPVAVDKIQNIPGLMTIIRRNSE